MWKVYRIFVLLLWLLLLASTACFFGVKLLHSGHMPSLLAVAGMLGWLASVVGSAIAVIWGILISLVSCLRKTMPGILDILLLISSPAPAALVLLLAPLK